MVTGDGDVVDSVRVKFSDGTDAVGKENGDVVDGVTADFDGDD